MITWKTVLEVMTLTLQRFSDVVLVSPDAAEKSRNEADAVLLVSAWHITQLVCISAAALEKLARSVLVGAQAAASDAPGVELERSTF